MDPGFPVLGDVSCIVMEGVDARRFAQAQFSGDVDALAPGRWQWNAWLTASGRVRALMHLVDPGGGTLLAVLRGGDVDATCTALSRYLMRTRAMFSVRRYSGCAGGPQPMGTTVIDPDGVIVLGCGERSLRLAQGPAMPEPGSQSAWRLADIRQGWCRLPVGEPEFLPPALGLEHLGAVSFGKGCYPGQELAARLHYRGGHKRRLYHVRGSRALPAGPVADTSGTTAAWILDAITTTQGTDALTVMPSNLSRYINILDNTFEVISRFEA